MWLVLGELVLGGLVLVDGDVEDETVILMTSITRLVCDEYVGVIDPLSCCFFGSCLSYISNSAGCRCGVEVCGSQRIVVINTSRMQYPCNCCTRTIPIRNSRTHKYVFKDFEDCARILLNNIKNAQRGSSNISI